MACYHYAGTPSQKFRSPIHLHLMRRESHMDEETKEKAISFIPSPFAASIGIWIRCFQLKYFSLLSGADAIMTRFSKNFEILNQVQRNIKEEKNNKSHIDYARFN